jgi:hypothetical protein
MKSTFYSPTELLLEAWGESIALFRKNPVYVTMLLLAFIVAKHSYVLLANLAKIVTPDLFGPFLLIVSALQFITTIVVLIAGSLFIQIFVQMVFTSLVLQRKRQARLGTFFRDGVSQYFPYLVVSSLTAGAIFTGAVVFVVPGIVFGYWYMFSSFILLNEKKRGITALVRSRQYTKGHIGRLILNSLVAAFPMLLAFLLIAIITRIFPGIPSKTISICRDIVSTVSAFFSTVVSVLQYEKLKEQYTHEVKVRRTLVSFVAMVGIVLLMTLCFWSLYTAYQRGHTYTQSHDTVPMLRKFPIVSPETLSNP